jgi:plastocyanin
MKNRMNVLGRSWFLFFPILYFTSCNSADTDLSKNTNSVDTVIIKQMQFFPAEINVNMGDTIVWINNDLVPHNVTSLQSGAFYSDTINVGASWKMEVKDSASYLCSIHPTMIAKINVK